MNSKQYLIMIFLITLFHISLSSKEISDILQKYKDWGKENGVFISNKLQIKAKSLNDKSLKVIEDIKLKEKLLSIPVSLILSVDKSLSFSDENIYKLHNYTFNETSFSLDDPFFNDYNKEAIYLSLIRYYSDKHNNQLNAFYGPYFNTYENDVSNFPLFYTETELKPLHLLDFGIKIIVRKAYIEAERLLIKMNFDNDLDEDTYTKYRHLTKAKSYLINNSTSLIPFLELFPIAIKKRSNCEWKLNNQTNQIEVFSTSPVKMGEKLLMAIDNISNDELLLDYGKTIEDNAFIREYLVDIVHHTWRLDDNLQWVSGENEAYRYDLLNLNFTSEFLNVYKEIAKEKKMSQDDITAYSLMIKNLDYYLNDYSRGNDDALKEHIINEVTRNNIKRILDNERMLIQNRIMLIKKLISFLHKGDL